MQLPRKLRERLLSPDVRRYLDWCGAIVGFLAIIFVGLRFSNYADAIDLGRFNSKDWLLLSLGVVLYGASNSLLAIAWRHLLRYFDLHVRIGWAINIYGRSQLAKYIPGNVFQFAGRQVLAMADGLPGRVLVKTIALELALLCLGGVIFGILAIPLLIHGFPISLTCGLFGLALILVWACLKIRFGTEFMKAWVCIMTFLALSGIVFYLCIEAVTHQQAIPIYELIAAYIIAWLIGLVTPGAPAGVGVREVVLIFLLHASYPESLLIFSVMIGRMVTLLGDVLFYLIANFWSKRKTI